MNFYIPDFWTHFNVNYALISLIKEHPEYFHEGLKIGAVYGTFPDAIWNSGRCLFGSVDQMNMRNTISALNAYGVPVRFTFTSTIISEHDCYDTFCNLILRVARKTEVTQGIKNEVLVNSPVLEAYLRENYPEFEIISSTTKCLNKDDFFKEVAENKYCLSVLDFHYNKDWIYLEELSNNHFHDRIEILINPYCSTKCTFERRKAHYLSLSKCQRNRIGEDFNCDLLAQNFPDCLKQEATFSVEELRNLLELGFKNFKIEGRTNHIVDVIESYVYYMVKPEYQMLVRNILLKS